MWPVAAQDDPTHALDMRNALQLGVLLPLPFLTLAEVPSLTVEEGTKVTKTYGQTLLLEIESLTITFNGEDQSPGESPEVTIKDEQSVVFVDEYVKVDEGRVLELVRTFESLSSVGTQSGPGPDGEVAEDVREGESELTDTSVRFRWDGDEEEYVVTWADDDDADPSELFDGLEVEAD